MALLHQKSQPGIALFLVMSITFVVMTSVLGGAAIILNNLDAVKGGLDSSQAAVNGRTGLERVKGQYAADNSVFDGCSANDCFDVTSGSCVSCTDAAAIYDNGMFKYQVKATALTQPVAVGLFTENPEPGSITLLSTGYRHALRSAYESSFCLNYCSVAGRNCGEDGCSGSCGTCTPPATCGGGGEEGVCGETPNCMDITMECSDTCEGGDPCGGGNIIDPDNDIVALPGGCLDTEGTGCGEGDDSVALVWDNDRNFGDTCALDPDNGELNQECLDDDRYEASRFCENLTYLGFEDWYLPAQAELDQLITAYNSGWTAGVASGCYWSSTEIDASTAYHYDNSIFIGSCLSPSKADNLTIRCVRRY